MSEKGYFMDSVVSLLLSALVNGASAGIQESASAAEELSAQAAELKHIVNELKSMIDGSTNSLSRPVGFSSGNRSQFTATDFIEMPDENYHKPSSDKIKSVNMAFEQ